MTSPPTTLDEFRRERGWAIALPDQAPIVAPPENVTGRRLLTVHAHPDDETTVTGGLLAKVAAGGGQTEVVTCTEDRGSVARIVDPGWDPKDTPRLAEIRTEELRKAVAALGVKPGNLHFLGYRDSGMPGDEANKHPDAFCNADLSEVTERITKLIPDFKPDVVVGYDDVGGYGHPDHIMAYKAMIGAVLAAGRQRCYPDAGRTWTVQRVYFARFPKMASDRAAEVTLAAGQTSPPEGAHSQYFASAAPDGWATTAVDCRWVYGQKVKALSAHKSQIPPDWPMRALPENVAADAFGTEYFHCAYSRVAAYLPETNVFAGITPDVVARKSPSRPGRRGR